MRCAVVVVFTLAALVVPAMPALAEGGDASFGSGLEVAAVNATGAKRFDHLALGIPVTVREPGAYEVRVTLARTTDASAPRPAGPVDASRTLAVHTTLDAGDHVVPFEVPGAFLANLGWSGPLAVDAVIADPGAPEPLDAYRYLTDAFDADDWVPGDTRLAAPPQAWLADADGDGTPDALTVDVIVATPATRELAVRACAAATTGGEHEACETKRVLAPAGGGLVVFAFPLAAFPGDGTLHLTARVDVDDARTGAPVDAAAAVLDPVRRETAPAPAATLAARAVDPWDLAGSGLAVTADVHVPTPEALDLRVRVTDAGSGRHLDARGRVPRDAAPDATVTLEVDGLAAAAVLANATRPVLHWTLLDVDGRAAAAGRTLLPGPLDAAFTVTPEAPVVGAATTFTDASTGPNRARGAAWAWYVGGEGAGHQDAFTHAFDVEAEHAVTLRVANALGHVAEATRTVRIGPAPPLDLADALPWTLTAGEPATRELPATDNHGRPLTWTLDEAPGGVTLADATLTWTPDAAGATDVRLTAAHAHLAQAVTVHALVGAAPAAGVTFTLEDAPLPAEHEVPAGAPLALAIDARLPDGTRPAMGVDDLPEGAAFADGVLAWPAPVPGTYALTVRAEWPVDAEARAFTLVISEPPVDGSAWRAAATDAWGARPEDAAALALMLPAFAGLAAVGLATAHNRWRRRKRQ